MDIVRIQSLLSEGRVADLSTLNGDDVFFQVGVYQKGNRRRGSGNLNSYAPAVFSLNQLLGVVKQFKYEVGQYVSSEGGVIAHRWWSTTAGGNPAEGAVQNYLVVGIKDLSGTYTYSDIGTGAPGARSYWDGLGNTTAIVAQGPSSGGVLSCSTLVSDGKSDWYMPAIQEFMKIWYNYVDISQGIQVAGGTDIDMAAKIYWTSTEVIGVPANAWCFRTAADSFQQGAKTSSLFSVRPVRKFSI